MLGNKNSLARFSRTVRQPSRTREPRTSTDGRAHRYGAAAAAAAGGRAGAGEALNAVPGVVRSGAVTCSNGRGLGDTA